jgi:hypothetical protein
MEYNFTEEQQATLSIYCDMKWDDNVEFPDISVNKHNIISVLTDYVNTGGDIAGGYIECVPSIINFIEVHYDNLYPFYMDLKRKGIYKQDMLEFLFKTYREFINQKYNY